MRSHPIFFLHLPKSGGTSVITALRSAFDKSQLVGMHDQRLDSFDAQLATLAQRDRICFIYSHTVPDLKRWSTHLRFSLLVREPVERMLSHFCFAYQQKLKDEAQFEFFSRPHLRGKSSFDYATLLEWIQEFRLDNFYVRQLVRKHHGHVDAADYAMARDIVRHISFIGTCDALPAFLDQIVGGATRHQIPHLHTNKSDRSVLLISGSQRQELVEKVLAWDLALLDFVRAEITRRGTGIVAAQAWSDAPRRGMLWNVMWICRNNSLHVWRTMLLRPLGDAWRHIRWSTRRFRQMAPSHEKIRSPSQKAPIASPSNYRED